MKSLSGGIKKLMICLFSFCMLVQNTDSIRAVNERRIVEKYNLLSEKHLDSGGGTRIMKGKGSAPQRLRFCGGKG